MKIVVIAFVSIILLIIISIGIYWKLPIEITRKNDIAYGNLLIKNIELYQKNNHRLPENNDWETLSKIGFNKNDNENPVYTVDDFGNYEIVYMEGFDGPYLIWSSKEKKWTIDFPKIFQP
ncbi:hypothetical protein [Chryseobacterium sp.]|uniref:hypothetical protein n=1 Tax=Chryseobacterium sp. TaxID=1871047 RepID=UPI00388F6F43